MRQDERTIAQALQREAQQAPRVDAAPRHVVRRVKRRRGARAAVFVGSIGIVVGVGAFALIQLSALADRPSSFGDAPSTFTPPEYPGARDVTVLASGTDPIAGDWILEVLVDDRGNALLEMFSETGGSGQGSAPIGDHIFGGRGATTGMLGPDEYSFDVNGVVAARVARVTLTLVDGTELEASLFPIPARFFGDAKAFMIFGDRILTDHRHPGRTLTAYDEDGVVLDVEALMGPDEPAGTSPEVDAVVTQLREVRDAITGRDRGDPFADLDMTALQERLPEIPLNASATAVPGEVSVRVTDARHLVLVATGTEAPVMCLSVEHDAAPNSGWNLAYGLQDAPTSDACHGGWDPYTLPPT